MNWLIYRLASGELVMINNVPCYIVFHNQRGYLHLGERVVFISTLDTDLNLVKNRLRFAVKSILPKSKALN